MQGYQLSNRPIRVSLATARRSPSAGMPGTHPVELDPTNTTLFIGGLSAGVSEDELRAIFIRYGDVVYTKIPQGKGCGFVQFINRLDAEAAMTEMNGQMVGSSAIRISWGRSTSRTAILQAQQRPTPGALGGYAAAFAPAGYGAAPGALVDPYGGVAASPSALAPAGAMYAAASPAAAGMYGIAGNAVYGGMPGLSATAGFPTGTGDAAAYVLATTQVGAPASENLHATSRSCLGPQACQAQTQSAHMHAVHAQPCMQGSGDAARLLCMPDAVYFHIRWYIQCLPPCADCALLLPLLVWLLQGFAGLQLQQPMAGQLLGATLQQQQQMYDPVTIDVSKLNSIFVQRQQPALAGAFIRPM
jgi:hypothetical protein